MSSPLLAIRQAANYSVAAVDADLPNGWSLTATETAA
jgi:hypothetical protein